jgi:hypothetical protein
LAKTQVVQTKPTGVFANGKAANYADVNASLAEQYDRGTTTKKQNKQN